MKKEVKGHNPEGTSTPSDVCVQYEITPPPSLVADNNMNWICSHIFAFH